METRKRPKETGASWYDVWAEVRRRWEGSWFPEADSHVSRELSPTEILVMTSFSFTLCGACILLVDLKISKIVDMGKSLASRWSRVTHG